MTNEDIRTISRVVSTDSIGEDGARFVIEPSEAERAAIAQRLKIPGLDKLRGEFDLTRTRGGADIVLALSAVAQRICVASLEPMTERVNEIVRMQFDRKFDEEAELDAADDDDILREPLDGDEIDLGELLVQHLSLSLSPYPRRDDAESLADKYRDAASASPFSSLKGLSREES